MVVTDLIDQLYKYGMERTVKIQYERLMNIKLIRYDEIKQEVIIEIE